jgi:ribonucleoside-diphosphate reductase alpha chain
VPLQFLVDKFAHMRFEPSGFTKNPQIPYAKSIVDYLFRWLASKFLDEQARQEVGVIASSSLAGASLPRSSAADSHESGAARLSLVRPAPSIDLANGHEHGTRQSFVNQADAPPCPDCGCIMVRNGTCYKCMNCGATSGCS